MCWVNADTSVRNHRNIVFTNEGQNIPLLHRKEMYICTLLMCNVILYTFKYHVYSGALGNVVAIVKH